MRDKKNFNKEVKNEIAKNNNNLTNIWNKIMKLCSEKKFEENKKAIRFLMDDYIEFYFFNKGIKWTLEKLKEYGADLDD